MHFFEKTALLIGIKGGARNQELIKAFLHRKVKKKPTHLSIMSSHNQFRLVKNEEKCEKNPLLKRNSVLSVPTFTYSKLSCRWRKWCLMNSSWHWSLGKKPVPHLLYVMLPLYLAFLSIFSKTIFPCSLPPSWILTFSIVFSKCDLKCILQWPLHMGFLKFNIFLWGHICPLGRCTVLDWGSYFTWLGLKALKLSLALLVIKYTFNDRFSMPKIL